MSRLIYDVVAQEIKTKYLQIVLTYNKDLQKISHALGTNITSLENLKEYLFFVTADSYGLNYIKFLQESNIEIKI